MSATVEITEEDGKFAAIDGETGATATGKTRAIALAALAVKLGAREGVPADTPENSKAELRALGANVRNRFEEESVDEEDVEDAIAWAR